MADEGNALRARGNAFGDVAQGERASPEGKVAVHKSGSAAFFMGKSGSPEIVISTGGKKRIDHTVQKR